MAQGEDTEITLGTGKLLGMFFALVVICAVFFGLGYSLGRSSNKQVATTADAAAPQPVAVSGVAKPSGAVKPPDTKPADASAPSTSDELTFYKSVEKADDKPQLAATPTTAAPQPQTSQAASTAPVQAPPEITKPAPGAFVVQVAAVSKQEDAEALLSALRKKQYPAFLNTTESDKLFHVQVGPFTDAKEAETMRVKLAGDGYSPIVKR